MPYDPNLRQAFEHMLDNEGVMIETIEMFAKFNRTYYQELLRQGFNQEQALRIVIGTGYTLMGGGSCGGNQE